MIQIVTKMDIYIKHCLSTDELCGWFQYDGTSVSTYIHVPVIVFFPIIPLEPLNCHF